MEMSNHTLRFMFVFFILASIKFFYSSCLAYCRTSYPPPENSIKDIPLIIDFDLQEENNVHPYTIICFKVHVIGF